MAAEADPAFIDAMAAKLGALVGDSENQRGLQRFGDFYTQLGAAGFFGKGPVTCDTPWPALNELLTGGGFQKGQLVIIGARPGMGKSALAAQLGVHAAQQGCGTAVFSLEMAAGEYWRRTISNLSRVSLGRLHREPSYRDPEGRDVLVSMDRLTNLPIWVDETTALSVSGLNARVRRLVSRGHPIGLVIVDYLGLLTVARGRQNRVEEVSEITRGLKLASRELKVPFVVLSQLSRESEKEERSPRLTDLRESGSVEQDADIVAFLHQDRKERQAAVAERRPGLMQIAVAKQRNGPVGSVKVLFDAPRMRMDEAG